MYVCVRACSILGQATMAARRAAARATTASDLPHHGAAYATATVRAENKTLARGTQLQVCSQLWGVVVVDSFDSWGEWSVPREAESECVFSGARGAN